MSVDVIARRRPVELVTRGLYWLGWLVFLYWAVWSALMLLGSNVDCPLDTPSDHCPSGGRTLLVVGFLGVTFAFPLALALMLPYEVVRWWGRRRRKRPAQP